MLGSRPLAAAGSGWSQATGTLPTPQGSPAPQERPPVAAWEPGEPAPPLAWRSAGCSQGRSVQGGLGALATHLGGGGRPRPLEGAGGLERCSDGQRQTGLSERRMRPELRRRLAPVCLAGGAGPCWSRLRASLTLPGDPGVQWGCLGQDPLGAAAQASLLPKRPEPWSSLPSCENCTRAINKAPAGNSERPARGACRG